MFQGVLYQDQSTIIGGDGDDTLRADQSVTFVWIADPGIHSYAYPLDPGGYHYWSGKSWANGRITFKGVAASELISGNKLGDSFKFYFTNGTRVSNPQNHTISGEIFWTQFMDRPTIRNDNYSAVLTLDHGQSIAFSENQIDLYTYPTDFAVSPPRSEAGHWELLSQPHSMVVLGGAGNDTIFGGQGDQVLLGGTGNDTIRAAPGDSRVFGGPGNDTLYAGVGEQYIDGGAGDDVLWGGKGNMTLQGGAGDDIISGGTGPMTLKGGSGNDQLSGGTGDQTLAGGAGDDTIWGGSGNQILMGDAGADILHASADSYMKFYGGDGADTFVFDFRFAWDGSFGPDDVMDFEPTQDIVQINQPPNYPIIHSLNDIPAFIHADAHGDAVLDIDNWVRLRLVGISADDAKIHPSTYFKLVTTAEPKYPPYYEEPH